MDNIFLFENKHYRISNKHFERVVVEEISNIIEDIYAEASYGRVLTEGKSKAILEGLMDWARKIVKGIGGLWSRVKNKFKLGGIQDLYGISDEELKSQTEKYAKELATGKLSLSELRFMIAKEYKRTKGVKKSDARIIAREIAKAAEKMADEAEKKLATKDPEGADAAGKAREAAGGSDSVGGIRGAASGDLAALAGRGNDILGARVGAGKETAPQAGAEPKAPEAAPDNKTVKDAEKINKDVAAELDKMLNDEAFTTKYRLDDPSKQWIRTNVLEPLKQNPAQKVFLTEQEVAAEPVAEPVKPVNKNAKRSSIVITRQLIDDNSLGLEAKRSIKNFLAAWVKTQGGAVVDRFSAPLYNVAGIGKKTNKPGTAEEPSPADGAEATAPETPIEAPVGTGQEKVIIDAIESIKRDRTVRNDLKQKEAIDAIIKAVDEALKGNIGDGIDLTLKEDRQAKTVNLSEIIQKIIKEKLKNNIGAELYKKIYDNILNATRSIKAGNFSVKDHMINRLQESQQMFVKRGNMFVLRG